MMTARELMEKILAIRRGNEVLGRPEIEFIEPLLSAALAEAHDQVVLEFGKNYQNQKDECLKFAMNEVQIKILEARAEAFEEAAGIAFEEAEKYMKEGEKAFYHELAARRIFSLIRRRAGEL